MCKLLWASCLFVLLSCASNAAIPVIKITAKSDTGIVRYDSSKVAVRSYDASALEKLRKDPEFVYKTGKAGDLTWWDRFWAWIWELLEKLFGGEPKQTRAVPYGKYIAIALVTVLAVYIILKLLGLENIFSRKTKRAPLAYTQSSENIHEIDFDTAIEKAWTDGNYRLGVRLLYLQTLKQLNDARLINWQIGKTNNAYLNELADEGKKESFGILTNRFEYIWYGDFPIDRDSYQRISALFSDFKKKLA